MSALGEANRAHWDGRAHDYDTKPWQQKMITYISEQLVQHRDLFGLSKADGKQQFALLDYACGPGTVSRALAAYVSHTQGIDVSDSMAAEYNRRSAAAGTASVATAVQGNLLAEEPYITDPSTGNKTHDFASHSSFNNFDAVIVGLGFHHFENWAGSLQRLGERVKSGGVVGIIDLSPSEEHWHNVPEDAKKMMHRSGFTREDMEGYMQEAGLLDFEMFELPEPVKMELKDGKEVERTVFFARGRRS